MGKGAIQITTLAISLAGWLWGAAYGVQGRPESAMPRAP